MRIEELRKLPDNAYVLYRNKLVCKVKIYKGNRYLLSNLFTLDGSYPHEIRTEEYKCGWFLCNESEVDDSCMHQRLKLLYKDGRRQL